MHVDELLAQLATAEKVGLTIPESWTQGRTVYGGLSAALLFHQMNQLVKRAQPEEHRACRYFDVSFIGPMQAGQEIIIEVELLRTGRSATQLTGCIKQGGQICVVGQACFGVKRPSQINHKSQNNIDLGKPDSNKLIPYVADMTPKFLQHLDVSLLTGGMPFVGHQSDYLQGWMRLNKTPKAYTHAHVITMIDAWPSTVLQQLEAPAMASTMNWNIQFTNTTDLPDADEWLAYDATTAHAADGYVFGHANIWNKNGELLAISRQTVGVFA